MVTVITLDIIHLHKETRAVNKVVVVFVVF